MVSESILAAWQELREMDNAANELTCDRMQTISHNSDKLRTPSDRSLWHVYYGTRGAAGAYIDALQKCLQQHHIHSLAFVSCSYRYHTRNVRKVFFPLTDRRENRNPIILAIRGIELILAYALIFGAAVFARPTLNVHLIDDYVATALFVRMCRVMRLRVFITCHDVYPHDLEIGASRISILCNADRLIVHTKDAERQLLGLLGAPAESRIKRCAFPFSSYDDLVPNDREKEKVLDSLPHDYFLFVGVVRLSKGIDLLIDAWSQMPPDRLDQLVIAGKWPAKLGDLRTQAEALPHCTVLDRYMTDIELSSLIGGASWVVLPYRRYTHSSILFSCLNAGIPVIVSDCELFRETLPGYELTFSEQNSSDLVRVLIRASESDIRPRCISHLQEIHRNHLNELISTIGDAYC